MRPPDTDRYRLHEGSFESYERLRERFEWDVPDPFNMTSVLTDRWADSDDVAIYSERPEGRRTVTFAELARRTDALANHLADRGIGAGDAVGINAPQKPETLLGHLAAWKLGAVSVPMSVLFGEEGLEYRLTDAGVDACIVDRTNVETFRTAVDDTDRPVTLTVDVEDRRPNETALGARSRGPTTPERPSRRPRTIRRW